MDLAFLTRRPVAHRGYHDIGAGRVENTLSAVRAAVARGFSIEVDVQRTADDRVVVFHDETLDRLTTATGRVDRRNLTELKAIPFKVGDDRIPSLEDLLDAVAGRVTLVIEIKSEFSRPADLRLVTRTVEILKAYRGPFALMSFDPEIVIAVRRLAPTFTRGIVADDASDPHHYGKLGRLARLSLRHILHAPQSRPHFIGYSVRHLPAPGPALLRRLFSVPVLTWTVRTPEQRAIAAAHADQMIFEGFDPEA